MISIIDYGLGNVRAFKNIFTKLNIDCEIVSCKVGIEKSKKLVLPGVGSFDWAMNKINKSGFRESLNFQVKEKKIPILGICVGMQIMAVKSEEGKLKGFGWVNAIVEKIKMKNLKEPSNIILPHMGWNTVSECKSSLFKNIKENSKFYFLHSYVVKNNLVDEVSSKTIYYNNFTSAFQSNNIYGVQFHPEKSHENGIKLLENFYNYC